MQKSDMGDEISSVKTSNKQQLRRFIEMFVSGVLATVMIFSYKVYILEREQPTENIIFGVILFGTFIPFFLIPALAMLKDFIYAFGHELKIYEGGIEHNYFGKSQTWAWHEIDALSYHSQLEVTMLGGIPVYKFHYFDMYLRNRDKQKIRIGKIYNDYQELSSFLLKTTTERWTKRDFKALQAGETLSYGNITVDKFSLKQGTKEITWKDIERVETNHVNQNFTIVPYGEKQRLFNIGSNSIFSTTKDVWNAHILLSLIYTILEMRLTKPIFS